MTPQQLKIIRKIVRKAGLENLGYGHIVQNNTNELSWIDAAIDADQPPPTPAIPTRDIALEMAKEYDIRRENQNYSMVDAMLSAFNKYRIIDSKPTPTTPVLPQESTEGQDDEMAQMLWRIGHPNYSSLPPQSNEVKAIGTFVGLWGADGLIKWDKPFNYSLPIPLNIGDKVYAAPSVSPIPTETDVNEALDIIKDVAKQLKGTAFSQHLVREGNGDVWRFIGEGETVAQRVLDFVANKPSQSSELPWRCLHCDEIFTDQEAAILHFGTSERQNAACSINIAEYRAMEARMVSYNEEDAEIHHQLASLKTKHAQELRREEEIGYARGLVDAFKFPNDGMPPNFASSTCKRYWII